MGGLISTMPITAVSFLFCAFSVMGIPPFGGFFSKYLIFSGVIKSGHLLIGLTFLVIAFMTILYLFRVFNLVFLGESQISKAREASPIMITSVALLGVLSILSGILVWYPAKFAQVSAQQMLGLVK
jgi:NADH:ubiquinone oxidoreductase subunit 5 (subunit L)/multisubunit Na+/H+ antiporter MnhA subunit